MPTPRTVRDREKYNEFLSERNWKDAEAMLPDLDRLALGGKLLPGDMRKMRAACAIIAGDLYMRQYKRSKR